jgi:predicted deacylase
VKAQRRSPALKIAGVEVGPGERRRIDVPVAQAYGQGDLFLPVIVLHGVEPGPRIFVSAAVHGDEIIGVEIIRRLLNTVSLRRLRGALIAVPIVNVYGFMAQSRYLPDRRDLNRSFPGSARGSLAARLAHLFMREVVSIATHGIDLHTGSLHRSNLPQVRACLDQPEAERLARAFGVPVIINANVRDGSLRQAVLERDIPMLLYEAGEALRFDEVSIRAGVRGVLSVMRALEMLPLPSRARTAVEAVIARSTTWVRAPEGGILRGRVALGARVAEGELLGEISDPVGEAETRVVASTDGILIGRTALPLVNEGDALFHIAAFSQPKAAAKRVETFQAELDPDSAEAPSGEPPIG